MPVSHFLEIADLILALVRCGAFIQHAGEALVVVVERILGCFGRGIEAEVHDLVGRGAADLLFHDLSGS
jgi:hypothetical protein